MKYLITVILILVLVGCTKTSNDKGNIKPSAPTQEKIKNDSIQLTIDDLVSEDTNQEDAPLPKSPFVGYFKFFTEGDYYHAVFKLMDSTKTSLWMPNDKNIERQLIDNRNKLLRISYYIKKDFVPEAGDTMKMEFIKSIEVVK